MQSLKKLDEYQKAVNNYLRTGSVAPTAQPETRTVSDISNEILKKRSPAAVQKLSEYNAYKWLGGKGLSDETMDQLGSQSFYMPEKPFNGAQGTYNQTASLQAFKDRFTMVDKFRSDGIWDVEGNNPYLFSDAFLNDQLNIWNQKLADSRAADEADKQKRNANAEVAARLKALSTDYYHGLTFDELLDVYEGDEDQISAVVSNWMALDQLNNPDSKYPKTWDELRNLETDNEYLAALHDLHEGWTNADWNNVGLVDRYESQTEDILRGMKPLQQEQAYRTTLSKFGGLAESAKNVPTLDAYYASNIPGYDPQYHNPEYATNLMYFLNHAVGGQEMNLMEALNDGLGEKLLWGSAGINADEDARKVQEYYDRGYHMLLPNELAIINRMANQPEAIQVFLNELEPVLLERRAEYMAAETQMLAQDPLMAFLMSAATIPGLKIAALQSIAGGLTGADPNSALFDATRDIYVTRQAVGENLGEALPFQVFGEELGTTLYNVGMSMFDMLYANKLGKVAAGGAPDQFARNAMQAVMSSEAAASTIYNDLQAGYNHEQAILHGAANGLIEAIYEKGFMDELFDFGKGFNARMWGATLAEAGEELGTEVTQTIGNELLAFMTGREGEINQIYQANIASGMNGTQAAFETLKHYGNQFALAGLSGAAMGAGVAGVTGVAEVAEGNYVGNSLKNQGDVEAMLSIAESMADGSEAKNAAEKIRAKQQAGKKVTNRDLGGLVKAVAFDIGAEHSGVVDSVLDEAVENRLVELGEDAANAKALAPVIREVTKGNQIKPKDRQAINWSEKASQVLKELNTVEAEDAPAEWTQKAMKTAAEKARPIKAKQMQFREAMTTKTTTTTAVNRAHERARKLSQNKLKLAPEMVAFTDSADGRQKQGKYEKAVRKNGEFYVEVKVDGQKEAVEVPAKDLQGAGDEGLATILEYAAYESRHEMSPEEVNIMAGSYKQQGGDVRGFISQFEESYLSGYSGVKAPPTQMASELQKIAYEHGKAEAAKDEGSRVARASRARATSKGEVSWIGKVKSDEEIKGRGSVEALPAAMENMTESQQTTVRIVQAFADKFKTNIALFDSSGGDVGGIQNGSYDPNTNTVYIDINSGANTTKGITSLSRQGTLGHAMVRTLGHELTHHLEATSADGYRVFKDAVKAEYKKQGKDWSTMVRSKIEAAVTAGQKLTYAGAEAEVVADASEYMLQNSKFVAEIDSSVKGKIKHFVQDFMQKLGEVFSKLTGGHIESKLLRQEINGVMQYMGNLQQLWDAAMEESIETAQSGETSSEIAEIADVNMPDGSAFVFNDNKKTEPTPAGGIPSEGKAQATHISSADYIVQKSVRNVKPEFDDSSTPDGIEIDEDTESAYPTQKSIRTWEASDYVANRDEAAQRLAKTIGVTVSKAKKWIDDVNSISAYVLDNKARLDYIPTAVKGMSAFKSNPEYGGSIDMSTIYAKRRLATGTLDAIQRVLGDAVLTKDDFLHIREMMKERGYEVACGLCFVESSRKNLSKYNRQFLDQYRAEHPDVEIGMVDLNTVEGLEAIRSNPETADIYAAYEKFMNKLAQRKPKLFEKRTEYNHEILKKFKSDTSVGVKNTNGGLRLQSFSDFEIVHLIDMMQVITDMASVGLAGQAYTKVPDFAWALGDTGLKINLSLIAKDVDADGNLVFDDIEGMNHAEAKRLRNAYSKNVGTIVVTFTDEQTIAAMKSSFIDYIIPFHRSQWQKGDYKKLGLPEGTKDYTIHQNEKEGRKRVKENFLPNAYWKPNLSGTENAAEYLKMCAKAGRTPKFAKFLENNGDGTYSLKADGSTDGYWKLLIDFKMYDNDGNYSKQLPVKPTFNMDQAMRMLADYKGEHDTFPVAQDVVDDFVKEYRGDKGGVKVEGGRYTVNPVQKSIRDLPDEVSVRGFLAESDNSIADTVEERNALSIYQKLLKDHADASDKVMAAERVLAAADEEDRPEARKALTAARAKQKDLYNRLLNVERTTHVQAVVTRTNRLISDLYGKNQADVDNRLSALRSQIESLQADLQGLKGAAKTQREADIRAAKREMDTLESRAVKALLANNERYAKRLAGLYERAEMNAEIGKHTRHIKRIVKRLNDRIIHEEDYKNVKEPMKPAVHKLVQTFIDGFGSLVFSTKTADHLRTVYNAIANDDGAPDFYSDDVANWLDDLAKLAAEDEARRTSGGSSLESVAQKLDTYSKVAEIADHIYKMVAEADEIFISGKRESFAAISGEVGGGLTSIKDKSLLVGTASKVARIADDLLRTGNMTPTYFFQHLNNSGLTKLFDGLMDGQREYAQSIREGQEAVKAAKDKYHFYSWKNMKRGVEFRTEQGHTIALTVPQMMWVYATAKREATNKLMDTHHLDQGGFKYESKDLPRQKGKATAIPGSERLHKLSANDVKKITDTLTAEQKACADELVSYLSNECAEQGNRASMEMFGIRKYNEEYYFPFKTASDQRHQRSDAGSTSTTNDARVKHTSFTHSLIRGANTPLVMGDFFDVIADHINQMATYSSFVVPIESMNRVLNTKVNEEADGSGSDVTIRSLVARKYGDPAGKYIADLIKDLNGGPQTDNRGGLNGLLRTFKRGAVMGSLSVALQQPTAIARAFAYVNPKYFAHITMEGNKKTWERMMQYSGATVIKDMGKFDVGTGKTANDWIANSDLQDYNLFKRMKFLLDAQGFVAAKDNFVEFLTALPGVMDRVTWTHIWKAVEAEQADLHPGMDRNSAEFLTAVGERFDYVINHTQVYDSILAKSQNMRSKNAFAQMSTAFMSEPTLNINMLYDAVRGKHTKGQRAAIISSVLSSGILAAAMASLIAAWNKDDDDRKLSEKYLAEFSNRAIDSVNPLTMIPYVADVWSMLNGYDIERTDLSVVKDVIDYTISFVSKAVDPEKSNTWRDYENFLGTFTNLLGIPAKNISRDIRRVRNLFTTDKSASSSAGIKYTVLENITPFGLYNSSNKAYCQRLIAAVVDGDTQEAYDLWDYLNNSKKASKSSINTNIRDELKRLVVAGEITPAQAATILRKYAPYTNDKDNTSKPLEWLKNK